MSSGLRRGRLARVVVAAVVAVPVLGAGTAQAAIGGGAPLASGLHPNLVSANIINGQTVQVCFDKPLANPTPSTFDAKTGVAGYRAANVLSPLTASPPSGTDPNLGSPCVVASFNAGDLTQYTTFTVAAGAVTSKTGFDNNADSVPLLQSATHAGTAAVASPPNLVGVLSPSGQNITFVFDQAIYTGTFGTAAGNINAADFHFEDAAGDVCTGSNAATGNAAANNAPTAPNSTATSSVTIAFPACTGGGGPVTPANATRAYVESGAATGASDQQYNPGPEGAIVPNTGGLTSIPALAVQSTPTAS